MFYIFRCPKEILPLKKGTVVICKTPHFTLSNHLTLFTGKKNGSRLSLVQKVNKFALNE